MGWRGEQAVASRGGNPAYGYTNSTVYNGGSGSGMGQAVAGNGQFAQGNGVAIGGTSWHPTILYLGALIIAEMVVFGFIARKLR